MITSFYTETIMTSTKFHTTDRVADLDLLFPPFRAKVEAIIADSIQRGTPLRVFETFRSEARQIQMYNQHLSQLKNAGVHQFGLACDIVFDLNGQPSWKGDFDVFGIMAKTHDLVWGGDWGTPQLHHIFKDLDHAQLIAVDDQSRLFNGTWYPSENYDAYTGIE